MRAAAESIRTSRANASVRSRFPRIAAARRPLPHTAGTARWSRCAARSKTPARSSRATASRSSTPRAARHGRQAFFMRVDAPREQRLEPLVDARSAERFFYQRVEAETRQVSIVENHGMPEVDGTLVIDVFGEHVEQRSRAVAVTLIPRQHRR